MKKKTFATMIIAVVAVAVSYNVYQSNTTNTLSDLALANVEALAFDENTTGASSILTTDLGNGTKCENGVLYSVQKCRIDCFGRGNLSCESGNYTDYSAMGPCQDVRTF